MSKNSIMKKLLRSFAVVPMFFMAASVLISPAFAVVSDDKGNDKPKVEQKIYVADKETGGLKLVQPGTAIQVGSKLYVLAGTQALLSGKGVSTNAMPPSEGIEGLPTGEYVELTVTGLDNEKYPNGFIFSDEILASLFVENDFDQSMIALDDSEVTVLEPTEKETNTKEAIPPSE